MRGVIHLEGSRMKLGFVQQNRVLNGLHLQELDVSKPERGGGKTVNMLICMYACMCVCMHACMNVCMNVNMNE